MPLKDSSTAIAIRIAAVTRRAWQIFAFTIWPVLGVAIVALFIIYVVRPFDTPEADDQTPDVAAEWLASVQRLGILPVYPPEQDFYVGDLWAVIADTQQTPLLGNSVRLAHLNVRDSIAPNGESLPMFKDTAKMEKDAEYRHQEDTEDVSPASDFPTPRSPIVLTITGFPGVIISAKNGSSGSGSSKLGLFRGQSERVSKELIRIPVAETYGIPTVTGITSLLKWCADSKTSIYCTDAFARKVLAFSTSNRILAVDTKGRYTARIELRLVTRVFYTRQIETLRSLDASKGYSADIGAGREGSVTTAQTEAQPGKATPTGKDGLSDARSGSEEISFHQTFQKPVAFGYRAVTIILEPSSATLGGNQ